MAPESSQGYWARFANGVKKSSVTNNPVTRTLIYKPAVSMGWATGFFLEKALSVPGAIAGNNSATIDGSKEIFQQQFQDMHGVLDRLREFNTTSGMSDEKKQEFDDRIDQAQVMSVARLKMAEEILKVDEEEKLKAEEKLRKQMTSLKGEADDLEKENANAIIGRILTALVGFDVLDVLDIAFSILENFVDTSFSSGVKNLVADETITGPLAKMAHAFRIDEFAGLLAKFPLIGDVNEGFTQFANSDYVSPFSSIIGQTMQSEAANLLFRGLVVARAVSQEVELSGRYKETQEKIDSAIPKMDEYIKDSINNHIEKMAPKIIELETRDELKHVCFRAFLDDKDTSLDKIFSNEFLGKKMRDADSNDSTTSIKDYLENLKNPDADTDKKEAMKDFAKNPQNRAIIEIILNQVDQKYSLNPDCNDGKENILKKITEGVELDSLKSQFLNGDFAKSFTPEVYGGIKKGLEEGKDLSGAIMGLEKTQIDSAIVAIAKIVKHNEMVTKIKTTTPKQTHVDRVMKARAVDSVTHAGPLERAL